MKAFDAGGRRRVLQSGAASMLGCALTARSQPKSAARSVTVAQVVDTSPAQQDVSRDFLIGSRAAWQDINRRGGVKGRPVRHLSIEVDGSPPSLQAALGSLMDNASCVVLSGTAGDHAATQLTAHLREAKLSLAHAAPWLQDSSLAVDERTFPIFAGRQEQIGHALKSLSAMNVQAIAAVFASSREHERYHRDVERIAAELRLQLQTLRAEGDLDRLGQRLTQQTPAVLLFLGGTPELVQLTRGLDKQARQRYVVALADVNLQTMMQMGAGRNTPVIATQAVPMLSASLPIVRDYREVLGRFFDEAPTALGLAGFIAARYTHEVLDSVEGQLTRQAALAAFQRRAAVDMGGYRISYDPRRRGGAFVTQSMLTPDGRVIGRLTDPLLPPNCLTIPPTAGRDEPPRAHSMNDTPIHVLFLCTHNSARSILAEAALNHLGRGRFKAFSAGSSPRENQQPHPLALQALQAAGIPTSGLRSKSWDEFAGDRAPQMDLIITVCDNAAGEACPYWPGHPATAHWGYADPSQAEGTQAQRLEAFRQTLRAMSRRMEQLVALPAGRMNKAALERSARELASS